MSTKHFLALRGAQGREVLFEVTAEPLVGAVIHGQKEMALAALATRAVESMGEIGEAIRRESGELIRGFAEAQAPGLMPAEIEVEFGVKLVGQGKLVFVEGGIEGHLHVKLKWAFGKES